MELLTGESLARYTTLKIGGQATKFCQPNSTEELLELLSNLKQKGEPWYIIGGGSNMLISSAGIEGTVIRTAQMTKVTQLDSNVIEAGAGTRLPHLARQAAALGLAGFEFAVGIPGTVGGGVIMNAGAHGSCVADLLQSVTIYDTVLGKLYTLSNNELEFQYRKSKLNPATQVVLSAQFKMNHDLPEAIENRIKTNEEYRMRTQPIGWPNAGSTFINPDSGRGAGYLLDQAGAKGLSFGKAAVSAVHANFVINMGGATSEEVATLMKRMQESVFNAFQVHLKPEWKCLGSLSKTAQEVWNG
jgi:UDP-N-acetylmuramate dehydrogenase